MSRTLSRMDLSRFTWAIVAALLSVSSPTFAEHDNLGLINVKALHTLDPQAASAAGDARSDDTAALQMAADLAKKRTQVMKPEGGSYLGSSPVIYFPAGRYVISDEIHFGPYTNIVSDAKAIIEQRSPDKRTFVFPNVYTISVRGLRFVGGKHQIWMDNKNTDSTMLDITDCEFQVSTDYAIFTQGTATPTDQHMSANLTLYRCKFINPRRVLRNVCDEATLRDTWVTVGMSNFDSDTAAFLNTAGTLMFDNMIGVPVFGGFDAQGRQTLETSVDHVRWVDNYGSFYATKTRFGGEFGGIPIVHHFGLPDGKYPKMGQTICIENSRINAGPRSRKDSAVVTLREGIPQLLRIVGNSQLVDGTFLLVDGFNVPGFLRANTDAAARIKFEIDMNMTWPATPPGTLPPVPQELIGFFGRRSR